MAEYVVVDKTQLDADLTVVADAIRAKSGTTEPLAFPQGMKQAVDAIQSGGSEENTLELMLLNELTEFSSYLVTTIKANFFQAVTSLERLSLPNLTSVLNYGIYGNTSLVYCDLGKITSLPGNLLVGCHKLETVILRSDSVATLPSAFGNSNNITKGVTLFYVPKALIEEYKIATNWTVYTDQFRAIEDYPEITGGML